MSFSVIIPTMWQKTDYLLGMLDLYEECRYVGEVLLIDNKAGFDKSKLDVFSKVSILNNGNNLFVNPSWNLGVSMSNYSKIILANDDILVVELDDLMRKIDENLEVGQIIGIGKNCFAQKRTIELGDLKVTPVERRDYGFGVFMALYKKSYVKIPGELKVWYGDTLLSMINKPFVVDGIDVKTRMRETSRVMRLSEQRKIERNFFQKLII